MSANKTIQVDGLVEIYDNKPIDPICKDDVILDIVEERLTASTIIDAWEFYVNSIDQQVPLSHAWIEKETQKAQKRIEATRMVIDDLDQFFFKIHRVPGDQVTSEETKILDECHEKLEFIASKLFKR